MLELTGHTGLITALAYSPDCLTLASASTDQTVRLWDLRTGTCSRASQFPRTAVSLCFSPDGQDLALGDNQAISVWSLDSGEIGEYLRERGGSCTVAYAQNSRSSQRLCCAGYLDNKMWRYNYYPRMDLVAMNGLANGTLALVSSTTKPLLAAGGGAPSLGSLCVWESSSFHVMFQRQDLPQAVYSLAFSPDGTVLASAGRENVIRLWNSLQGREVAVLMDREPEVRHSGYNLPLLWSPIILGLAFTTSGETLISARDDGVIRFWDISSQRLRSEMDWKIGKVRTMALAPDGMTAAVGGSDCNILVWDLED